MASSISATYMDDENFDLQVLLAMTVETQSDEKTQKAPDHALAQIAQVMDIDFSNLNVF